MVVEVNNQFGMSALKSIFDMGLLNKNSKPPREGITKQKLSTRKEIRRKRNKASHASKMRNFKLAKTRNGRKHFKV